MSCSVAQVLYESVANIHLRPVSSTLSDIYRLHLLYLLNRLTVDLELWHCKGLIKSRIVAK